MQLKISGLGHYKRPNKKGEENMKTTVTEKRLTEIGVHLIPQIDTILKEDDQVEIIKRLFMDQFEIEVIEHNNEELYIVDYNRDYRATKSEIKELLGDSITVFDDLESEIKKFCCDLHGEDSTNIASIISDSQGFYDIAVVQDNHEMEFQVSLNPHTQTLKVDYLSYNIEDENNHEEFKELSISTMYWMLNDYSNICEESHFHSEFNED